MKIKFLGTGASEGIPAIFCECEVCRYAWKNKGKFIRTRAGVLVDDDTLIDFSPDAYTNALKYDIHLSTIKTVLMTHSHEDHFFPMDMTSRASRFCQGRQEDILTVYGGEPLTKGLKQFGWQRNKELTRNLQYNVVKPKESFETPSGHKVTAYPTPHMLDEECYIYLIEKGGKSYLQCHDSGEPYDWVIEDMKAKGVKLDMVALDCTYGLIEEEYGGHMNLNQNVRVKNKMMEMGVIDERTKVFVTHIAHCGGVNAEIEQKANANGMFVAYDGLEVEL